MSDENERSVASAGSTGGISSKAKSVLRVASAAGIRNGEYLGQWSGYQCRFEAHGGQYVAELEKGIRGTADCVVSVLDGDITARIVVRQ